MPNQSPMLPIRLNSSSLLELSQVSSECPTNPWCHKHDVDRDIGSSSALRSWRRRLEVEVLSDGPRFEPGRDVHPIQARLALEGLSSARPARIQSVDATSLVLVVGGSPKIYVCADAHRLATLIESGRCALTDGTAHFGLLSDRGVLVVPASDECGTISKNPTIDPDYCVIADGAAIQSPTDGGAWHLFGVTLLDD